MDNKKDIYEFGFISYNYLFKNTFKIAIYVVVPFILLIFSGFISIISRNNYIKRIFNSLNFKIFQKKYYYIIIFISLIDTLNFYLLNRLVSNYAIVDLITDYFTNQFFYYIWFYIIIYLKMLSLKKGK